MPSAAPAVPDIDLTLTLTTASGPARTIDLTTRAVVVATVPTPRFGREAEVLAGVAAAAAAGADVVEVPAESKLLGPAVRGADIPVAATVTTPDAARRAVAAGAALLLVPHGVLATVLADGGSDSDIDNDGDGDGRSDSDNDRRKASDDVPRRGGDVAPSSEWTVATVVASAAAGRDAVADRPHRPVLLDVTGLAGADAVSEESLALAVGVRLILTNDVRRTRRVVEVMAHLLAARR